MRFFRFLNFFEKINKIIIGWENITWSKILRLSQSAHIILLLELYLFKKINFFNLIVLANTVIDQYEFCRIYHREGIIIPYGIKKGYPLNIDFINLSNRILNIKSEC